MSEANTDPTYYLTAPQHYLIEGAELPEPQVHSFKSSEGLMEFMAERLKEDHKQFTEDDWWEVYDVTEGDAEDDTPYMKALMEAIQSGAGENSITNTFSMYMDRERKKGRIIFHGTLEDPKDLKADEVRNPGIVKALGGAEGYHRAVLEVKGTKYFGVQIHNLSRSDLFAIIYKLSAKTAAATSISPDMQAAMADLLTRPEVMEAPGQNGAG